jgi:hypothetical protein
VPAIGPYIGEEGEKLVLVWWWQRRRHATRAREVEEAAMHHRSLRGSREKLRLGLAVVEDSDMDVVGAERGEEAARERGRKKVCGRSHGSLRTWTIVES